MLIQNCGSVKGWRYIPCRGGGVTRRASGWVYNRPAGAAGRVMSSVRRITGTNPRGLLGRLRDT